MDDFRILIVDDELQSRSLIAKLISNNLFKAISESFHLERTSYDQQVEKVLSEIQNHFEYVDYSENSQQTYEICLISQRIISFMITENIFETKYQYIEFHDNELQADVQCCMSKVAVR